MALRSWCTLKAPALLAVDHYREVSESSRVPPQVVPFQGLEPNEVKVSCPVLMGERAARPRSTR